MRTFGITALGLAFALGLGGTSLAETRLKLGHIQPANDSVGQAANRFAELVRERTDGEVVITVHAGGELGGSQQLAEGVRLGTVDIIITGTPFWSNFEPMLNVLDLPYIFANRAHAHAVADSDVGAELMGRLERHGVKGLAFYELGFRDITNSEKPIQKPEDLRGIKIRVSPNKAHTSAFQIWGANPVSMSFTEVYMALQTGAIDGQENPIHIIATGRLSEVQKYLSLTEHAYSNTILAINLRKFRTLTEDQQTILLEAAQETAAMQREINEASRDEYLADLKESGMEVIEAVDRKPFMDAVVGPVWGEFAEGNEGGQAFIDRILAIKPKS